MVLPKRKPATYQDLVDLPENVVGEILDGALHVSPRPASPHAQAASMLHLDIGPFQRRRSGGGGPGGWWILFEPELHLGADVLVPDLAGWRVERMPEYPNVAGFELAPDWVCEVVSPSSARHDRVRKSAKYATAGVNWLWLVDPLEQTLEAYRLENGRWLRLGGWDGADVARVEPFEAIELDLAGWWHVAPLPDAP